MRCEQQASLAWCRLALQARVLNFLESAEIDHAEQFQIPGGARHWRRGCRGKEMPLQLILLIAQDLVLMVYICELINLSINHFQTKFDGHLTLVSSLAQQTVGPFD